MAGNLKCDECGKLTVQVCPTCGRVPLCEDCRAEHDMCSECDDDDDDTGDVLDEMEDGDDFPGDFRDYDDEEEDRD